MERHPAVISALVPCIFALFLISFFCPATTGAQTDSGKPQPAAKPARQAYTPPPDQLIYFRPGPGEKTVAVTAVNFNVPDLPANLGYLKQTIETLEEIGFEVPDNSSRAAVQVRATAKYNQVDNSQAVANETRGKTAAGAILGALGGIAAGGGGRGAAQGAAGGAASGLSSGTNASPIIKYFTIEFDISSKKSGPQIGRITKDVTNIDMGPEEAIDAIIADYLRAALPSRR